MNTVVGFDLLNGYRFDYDAEIRTILNRFGTDENMVNEERAIEYLQTNTEEIDLAEAIGEWRSDLIQHGLERLRDETSDPND